LEGISAKTPFCVGAKAPDALGDGWMDFRVGAGPSESDTASSTGSSVTVAAGAGDLWSNSDVFHYICHPLDGDGSLVVQLNSVKGTSDTNLACAGIVVRQDLAPGSPDAGIMVLNSPDQSAVFLHRDSPDGDLNFNGSPAKARCG
jgi:hypothetical protein